MHLSRSPKSLLNDGNSWYFVRFLGAPNATSLQSHGIHLPSYSFITSRCYNLFLSASQARYLISHSLAELAQVTDKLIATDTPLSKCDFLVVEVAPSFQSSDHETDSLHFSRKSDFLYHVSSSDPHQAVQYLSTLPEVFAITPSLRPQPRNRQSSGYSQKNTKELHDGGFDRPLNIAGLTGRGVVVVVIEQGRPDWASGFFYDDDPNCPPPQVYINEDCRKIIYSVFYDTDPPDEHATHVCGILAGHFVSDERFPYDGVAPDAKLALMNERALPDVVKDMENQWESRIASASLGDSTYSASSAHLFDKLIFDYPNVIMVFAAGNERLDDYGRFAGFASITSQAASKNVLAVGALTQLPVDVIPEPRRWLVAVCFDGAVGFMVNATLDSNSPNPFINGVNELTFAASEACLGREICNNVKVAFARESPGVSEIPVFLVADEPFWTAVATTFLVHQEYRTGDVGVWEKSSRGPSHTGIIKPDVVAPGQLILSASNLATGETAGVTTVRASSGTSMATPNVAGCLALIDQYLKEQLDPPLDGEPRASLMKAIIVNCADVLNPKEAWPNNVWGFGQVNLVHLPIEHKGNMIVANIVEITDRQHLVAKVTVTAATELRITIAWTDDALAVDSFIPLWADLDLIVKSPSGELITGNSHSMEERFSTIERVIVDTPAIGEYEIHVIAAIQNGGKVEFSAVAIGDIDQDNKAALVFEGATACVSTCHQGECTATQICDCSETDAVGQFCQHSVEVLKPNNTKTISVGPVDLSYFKVTKTEDVNEMDIVINTSGPENVVIPLRCFSHEGVITRGIPFEYSNATWQNTTDRDTLKITTKASVVSFLVKNDMSQSVDFAISVNESQSSDEDTDDELALILGITAGVVTVVGGVVALITARASRKGNHDENETENDIDNRAVVDDSLVS